MVVVPTMVDFISVSSNVSGRCKTWWCFTECNCDCGPLQHTIGGAGQAHTAPGGAGEAATSRAAALPGQPEGQEAEDGPAAAGAAGLSEQPQPDEHTAAPRSASVTGELRSMADWSTLTPARHMTHVLIS